MRPRGSSAPSRPSAPTRSAVPTRRASPYRVPVPASELKPPNPTRFVVFSLQCRRPTFPTYSMEKIILMRILSVLGVFGVLVAVAGCGGTSDGSGGSKSLSLVAYSTPQEAYEGVIPAFQKTEGGAGVTFKQSYGASGDQARAVLAGLPADVVALSLEPDVNKLVDAGKVPENWASGPQKGIVTDSVVVLATRPGNPKNIKTWDDIVKPGVQIVTPNPQTSGGAKWNLMAAYGAQIKQGKTP